MTDLSRTRRAAILREVAAHDRLGRYSVSGQAGRVAGWMERLADELEGIVPPAAEPDDPVGGIFGEILGRLAREPGEDDDT